MDENENSRGRTHSYIPKILDSTNSIFFLKMLLFQERRKGTQ